MQDLARAAGMSAGNFYRYFPSKDAIVAAMCELDLSEMAESFEAVRRSPDPAATFRRLLHERVREHKAADGALWAQIDAEAFRRPEVARIQARMHSAIRDNLVSVFQRIHGTESAIARREFEVRAELMILMVTGLGKRVKPHDPDGDRELDAEVADEVLRQIEAVALAAPRARTETEHRAIEDAA